jgi:hypothetical protein
MNSFPHPLERRDEEKIKARMILLRDERLISRDMSGKGL